MATDWIGGTAGSRLPTGVTILDAITNILAAGDNALTAITNAHGEI